MAKKTNVSLKDPKFNHGIDFKQEISQWTKDELITYINEHFKSEELIQFILKNSDLFDTYHGVTLLKAEVKFLKDLERELDSPAKLVKFNPQKHLNFFPDVRVALYHDNRIIHVELRGLEVETIPSSIGRLAALETFSTGECECGPFPDEFANLKNLKGLRIYDCYLEKVPDFFGKFTKLEQLIIDQNEISEIPDFLGSLTELRHINLYRNDIKIFPEVICQFKKLEYLNISWNEELHNLSGNIGALVNLNYLDLDQTAITAIPESLGLCTNLVQLKLPENVKQLPASLLNLNKLEELQGNGYLKDNPIYIQLKKVCETNTKLKKKDTQ